MIRPRRWRLETCRQSVSRIPIGCAIWPVAYAWAEPQRAKVPYGAQATNGFYRTCGIPTKSQTTPVASLLNDRKDDDSADRGDEDAAEDVRRAADTEEREKQPADQ